MKFGVVIFPGSNCDMDMVYVLETIMEQEVVKLWHKDTDLQEVDFIILPGGFSYGDYLRAGAIAKFSPIMSSLIEESKKGKYIIGICNGFQILIEAGILPGALIKNKKTTSEDRIDAINKLSKLPNNSALCRLRTRCIITGRPRSVYRKFKLSRIAFRELANEGKLPGVIKSSW